MVALAAVAAAACGTGGDQEGGGLENLPVSGAGPYSKLDDPALETPIDEPTVLEDGDADLTDPAALHRAGGGFRLFYTRTPRGGGPAEIWRRDLRALDARPVEPAVRVLAADRAWEEGSVRAPSVVGLADGALVLFYEAGTAQPAIGRARSDDDGASWVKDDAPVLTGAADPGALAVDDTIWLVFVRPGAPGVLAARADAGGPFVVWPEPVLGPRPDDPGAFDHSAILEPALAGGNTAAGRLHLGLFYTGVAADGRTALGYAGSFDGETYERPPGGRAILEPLGVDERGPGPVRTPSRAVLFFSQPGAGLSVVAAATSP